MNKFWLLATLVILFHLVKAEPNRKKAALVAVDSSTSDEKSSDSNAENTDSMEIFKPTREWQVIKPGQVLPAGLHVRINLQTGLKEAKYLDENESQGNQEKYAYWKTADGHRGMASSGKDAFSPEELKEALKLFKEEQKSEVDLEKFRNIEELKKDFEKLKLNAKSDTELLKNLVEKYRKANEELKVVILQDIEYLVHQYDAAQDFVKMGGIEMIIPDLNSTESSVREMVAFTIGSASQGNTAVQIAVLETPALNQLLRLVVFDKVGTVQARSLYAISCLVRQFPFAQQRLLENGGLSAFAKLFKQDGLSSEKLKLKAVTLLHDLIVEQQLTKKYAHEDSIQKEKLTQYKSVPLKEGLVQHGFCTYVPKLLQSTDHDTQEKVISAMLTMVNFCRDDFATQIVVLQNLSQTLQIKAEEELTVQDTSAEDLYFTDLYKSLNTLILFIEQRLNDEL